MNDMMTYLAIASLAGLLVGFIVARSFPFHFISAIMRTLSFPFRFISRLVGLGRRSVTGAKASPLAARHAFRHKTVTEVALGDDFDFEKQFVSLHGFIFRWMGVRVGFMKMSERLTDELSDEYAGYAEEYMGRSVPISSDPRSLYEDVEGGVLATQFHKSDSGVIYLLNQSRKMMNANVLNLTIWFSLILTTALIVNLLYNDGHVINFAMVFGNAGLPVSDEAINSLGFGLLSNMGAAFIMWLLYYTGYAPFQRNNAREMANYLTRYLARVNDHYRTSIANAKSVTVGQEKDTQRLAHEARKWHLITIWLAFRVYFVETYVRNCVYQINRNSTYYLVFVPTIFIVIIAGIFVILSNLGLFNPFERIAELGWVFAVLFVTVVATYISFLTNAMGSLDEIDQGEWISFNTLRLDEVMGEIVGKYAEDVGYWKNRVGGGL